MKYKNKTQINLYMESDVKEKLAEIARERAYMENKDIGVVDLINEAIKEKYNFSFMCSLFI